MSWKLFVKNPFRLLQEHMKRTKECVNKIHDLFDALFAKDKDRVAAIAKDISRIEHECDEIKKEIRQQLVNSVFLPIERRDLLQILFSIDLLADYSEDIGVLLTMRWMELPDSLVDHFRELLARCFRVVEESCRVVEAFERLLDTGFTGPDADDVLARIDEIARLEHLADKAQDIFGKALFVHEDEMKPAALLMWMKISNKVGDLANGSERMVNHLRVMLS